jgi:shikimate kinase
MEFVDTDVEIVLKEGNSIPEIFESKGESYFRQLESSVIREIATRQHTIISTGGGAVLNPENMALLHENGKVYFLDRSPKLLCTTKDRPLSSNSTALEQLYRERYSIYCRECDVKIPGDNTVETVVNLIREDLKQ